MISLGDRAVGLAAGDAAAESSVAVLTTAMGGHSVRPWQPGDGLLRVVCDADHREPRPLLRGWPWPTEAGGMEVRLPAIHGPLHATPVTNAALLAATLGRLWPDAGLYHGALVAYRDQGVLLAAPGGTGKSTACARLPETWQVLCDDTTLLVADGAWGWWAHPWPTWSRLLDGDLSGRWPVEERVRPRLVCFLEQAPVDELVPVGGGEASGRLSAAAEQARLAALRGLPAVGQRQARLDWFAQSAALARTLPAYRLRLTLTGRFWELLEPRLA